MGATPRRVQDQFGPNAEAFVTSPGHASGEDLENLLEWAELKASDRALDIATGGGHVALALSRRAGEVVATDLTPEMLEAARAFIASKGATNVAFREADAQALPFEGSSFNVVACRIAPHHFPDPGKFVREARRVLRPKGRFLMEDSVVPRGPYGIFLNRVEALRDPSHVRSLALDEWESLLLESGFRVERLTTFRKRHGLDEWMDRMRTPAGAKSEILEAWALADPAVRWAFQLETENGRPTAYWDTKALFLAIAPD